MAERKNIDGSLALADKQYRVITIEATEKPRAAKLRVAAYARVSSSSADQLNSFAAQNDYYRNLIHSKDNWMLADIYADEGISGTSAEKRPDFQRLLADCHRGLIDRIVVKSISRFARNARECLEAIRELKLLGVGVYFEEQNIDTATMSGEMLTALFAAIAEEESKSISRNTRWGNRKRMAAGTYLPSSMPYGYRLIEKEIVIEPNEALVVCQIYQDYLAGMGMDAIARKLNEQGVPPSQGKKWGHTGVAYILRNERYIGDSLWQKTYATESFPPQQVRNKGELPKYYAEGTHPPILSKEVFEAAQRLAADRKPPAVDEPLTLSPFSRRIVCGQCGKSFRKRVCREQTYWLCRTHEKKPEECGVTQIPASELCEAFLRLYYNLKHSGADILPQMLAGLQTIRERKMLWSSEVVEINTQISKLSSENQMWADLKCQGLVDPDIFIVRTNELAERLRHAKLKKERLLIESADDTIGQTEALIMALEAGPEDLDSFDAELFDELVEKIVVDSNEQVRFRLKNGLELCESVRRTMR